MENIQSLHWQLSVLSKAIHYKNLSGAASHVGLSQPQLSRIIARLEQELGVVLLDRAARRKSGWTPIAFKIAETYFTSSRKLTQALQQLTSEGSVTSLAIGTLEGLVPLATEACLQLFGNAKMQLLELNVYDLNELEEHFEKNELDLIFTFREPSKHKYRFNRTLGYQALENSGSARGPRVYSQFDYANRLNQQENARTRSSGGSGAAGGKEPPVLLSNSLSVRRLWIEEHGGHGIIPSTVRPKRLAESDLPVLLLASDLFNPALWQKIERFRL